ncbi:energy transducer TonB [Pseudoalteromonas sp. MMG024]|uniref:energy transducer TonB n=1 Tax=Pseudoalteromonas sp. MMG024 TaxID=2909980 RepID=UPI001F38025A|nr:energy transducer TonB [Pseudoalteromonas sp. MMG024]MCF6456516.1 energy transducer TonB [Pseudoalteromonas sp. MMG024]
MILLPLITLSASALSAADTSDLANKTEQLHINTIVNAEAIKREPPKYPINAARNGKEGWVQLSFVVEPDGSTSNIIVEDSSNEAFEKYALRSIKKWKYSPATKDGKPIQQCRNQVQLDFKLSNAPKGASKWFFRQYRSAMVFLEENKVAEAEEIAKKIEEKGRWNAYEDMYYSILTSLIAEKNTNPKAELAAIQKVLSYDDLQKEAQYSSLAARAFSLAVELQEYGDARSIFATLKRHYPENEKLAMLSPYYNQVTAYLKSDKPIIINAQISKRDFWSYQLERSAFIIDNVVGNLTNLEVRCDNHHSQFLVESGNKWQIPESWGSCSVYVFGDTNAQFTLADVHGEQKI